MDKYELNLMELVRRFDRRVAGQTGLTGKISSALGELLLIDLLGHALARDGAPVVRLVGVPHRDNQAFAVAGESLPSVRDLDAWVLMAEDLVAVECKHWTSSSRNGISVPDDVDERAAYARCLWDGAIRGTFTSDYWDEINKVALPLKAPDDVRGTRWPEVRRVLAVWTPISEDGRSVFSEVETKSLLRDGRWAPLTVEVFSGSLFVRELQDRGITHLPLKFPDIAELMEAFQGLFRP